jgi:hypothetical protein
VKLLNCAATVRAKSPSPIQQIKSLEQEQTSLPPSLENEGIFMEALAEQRLQDQVRLVADAEFEATAVRRFEQWIGSLSLQTAIENTPHGEKNVSLLERIQAARAGSAEAMASVNANVSTALFEALFKENYVSDTYMERDTAGNLFQHGQTNDDIHRNSLTMRPDRHPLLRKITEAEALNRHRIETALEVGQLRDNYFVVFSLVPNGISAEELGSQGEGYFLDSLSLGIQATTELQNGRVQTETGFMAGVEALENDNFADRIAKRHDFAAVQKLYEWFGQKAPDAADELLANGLAIPKAMMQNGVTDVMYWLAVAKDAVLGRETNHTRQEFAAMKLESKRRERRLKDVQQQIVENLLLLSEHLDDDPMQAVSLLWELVRQHATEAAFTNYDIDPIVLGRSAATDIMHARYHLENGNLEEAEFHKQKAHLNSEATGCGGGSRARQEEDHLEKIAGKDTKGSRAFKCKNGHLNIRPKERLIPSCQHPGCKAEVACK